MNSAPKVLSFTALMVCLVVAFGCWTFRTQSSGLWLGLAGVFLVLFIWSCLRPGEPPDRFRELGLRSLERDGLCFTVIARVEEGRVMTELLLQNRYAGPCDATFVLRPSEVATSAGLEPLRTKVQCLGGATGRTEIPWALPKVLEGQTIVLAVGATVEYPEGRGRLVRHQQGVPVGSAADVEDGDLAQLLQSSARLELRVPAGSLDPAPDPRSAAPKVAAEATPGVACATPETRVATPPLQVTKGESSRGCWFDAKGPDGQPLRGCPHHYFFAKVALPRAFFASPLNVVVSIDSDLRQQSLGMLWDIVRANCDHLGTAGFGMDDLVISKALVNGMPTLLIQMPEPSEPTEAYFVAMVLLSPLAALSPTNPPKGAYYTLEKTRPEAGCATMLCGYSEDGAHLNYGPGPEPSRDEFIKVIEKTL